MTPALRWQWWEPFVCFINCEGQSPKTVSADHNLWRERIAEAGLNQGPYGSHFIPCKTFRVYSGICSLIMRDWHCDSLFGKRQGLAQHGTIYGCHQCSAVFAVCLQVLPLKWVCPGRRPPEKEVPEQPMDFMSDEEDDEDKDEEKRCVRCFLIIGTPKWSGYTVRSMKFDPIWPFKITLVSASDVLCEIKSYEMTVCSFLF